MTQQLYPFQPGTKELSGTSAEAAESMKGHAGTLRGLVLETMRTSPLRAMGWTTDEMAEFLNTSILSIRPRFSELKALGMIYDTGERRLNNSGRKAVVWHCLKPSEQMRLV